MSPPRGTLRIGGSLIPGAIIDSGTAACPDDWLPDSATASANCQLSASPHILARDVETGAVTKLTLAYDGTDFSGWARQPGLRTVQEELERALEQILGEPLALSVAGRTDRGVHAWGQVASYRHEALDPRRLNALLPDDVAVLSSEPAPGGFDARRSARSRTYCYRVLTGPLRSPFEHGRALWVPGRIDAAALRACAARARRHAPLHRLHPDRDRPRALRATRAPGALGGARTRCSSSGSRPTASCAR